MRTAPPRAMLVRVRVRVLLSIGVLPAASTNAPVALSAAPSPAAPSPSPSPDARLDGVVLLLRTTQDDKLGYGAGVLLDDDGLVLTALHVVAGGKDLRALTYDATKPLYTAADGGISRLWFERYADLRPVTIIKGDPITDLAIVKIGGGTSSLARLKLARSAPPRFGDSVVAIGHPAGNPWSFSQGLAGAPRDGFIEHSAKIAPGSS